MRTDIPFALSALVVIAVAITGCGGPTPTPTALPTASETPSSVEAPLPRLPITCEEILAPTTVATFAGAPVPLGDDGTGAPDSWWDVMHRQSGALSCTWMADRDLVTLSLTVVPDSERFFYGSVEGYSTYYERYDEVGDRSVHSCSYGQCSFSILVGDYLIGGYANRPDLMDELDLLPLITPVLTEVVATIEGAIPAERAAWVAPDGVLRGWGWGCGDAAPIAELGAIFGMIDPYSTGTDWDATTAAVFAQVEPSWCTLASEQGTVNSFPDVVVVEGGGWVVSEWEADPPTTWSGTPAELIAVDGVGTGYLFEDGSRYSLLFPLEGSVVSVSVDASSRAEFLGWAAEVAEFLSTRAA